MLGRQRLRVDAVAGLVQDAEERLVEESRVVPRRDAAVAGADAGAERVSRRVEPARFEIETDSGRRGPAKRLLPVRWEFAGEDVPLRRAPRGHDPLDER